MDHGSQDSTFLDSYTSRCAHYQLSILHRPFCKVCSGLASITESFAGQEPRNSSVSYRDTVQFLMQIIYLQTQDSDSKQ